jgi:hypothetical protein
VKYRGLEGEDEARQPFHRCALPREPEIFESSLCSTASEAPLREYSDLPISSSAAAGWLDDC